MAIFDLRNRVAVITGGNGGIGLAVADALAEQGCGISIWGRNPEKNTAAKDLLSMSGATVHSVVCDISSREQAESATQQTLDFFGRIDGCFANAGIGGGGRHPFVDRTAEDWRNMFAVNLDGAFNVLQPIVRHMVERAEAGDAFGRIAATSSMASLYGTARNEHYAASKSGLNSLMRAIAVEHARFGITANAILPGWVDTEMTEGLQGNDKFMDNAVPRIPMRRFAKPADFGGIAVYLMSSASAYHTGDCIVIDGGYSAF